MRLVKLRRFLLRGFLVLLLLGGLFLGIAFLPGQVEGNYRGIASSCGCDGITFINLREGKLITYHSAHPPAWLSGRYQNANGAVELYLDGLRSKEAENMFMKAYPRFLITKFVSDSEGEVYWCWKWPAIGRIGESLRTQEVTAMRIGEDGVTRRNVFDCDLKPVRSEIKTGPNQWAEQAGTEQPATHSLSKSEGGDKPQPDAEGRSR
jgi:hypothetical protein